MRNRSPRPARRGLLAGLLVALLLISSTLACSEWIPEYTPNPPQMTAGALNGTYEAEAAWTAEQASTASPSSTPTGPALTATPILEPSPQPSPTSSIIEVTPLGGAEQPWIVVLGDGNEPPQPGVWVWAHGTYYSFENWNVRGCEDLSCAITGSLSAGQTIPTVGGVVDGAGAFWLCRAGVEGRDWGTDTHGAQWCNQAFLAWSPIHGWNGIYEVTQ